MMALNMGHLRLVRTGYVGFSRIAPSSQTHSHRDEYEFHFFAEGRGRFRNDRDSFLVAAPALTFTVAGMAHGLELLQKPAKLHLFFLCFEIEPALRTAMRELYESFRRVGSLRMGMDSVDRVEQLVLNHQSPDPLLNLSAQHQFLSLLCEVMWRVKTPWAVASSVYVGELVKQMRKAVNGTFDLGTAAAGLGVSKAHLVRVFKRSTGLPPLRYFNRMKMNTARERLKRTDMPLARIAEELSFCDEYYFSRVFKKYAGVAPDHFRKMHRTSK